jgi:hypothetical protein
MKREPSRSRHRLPWTCLLGLVLLNYPLLTVVRPGLWLGVPSLFFFLFAVWAFLIAVMAMLVERD